MIDIFLIYPEESPITFAPRQALWEHRNDNVCRVCGQTLKWEWKGRDAVPKVDFASAGPGWLLARS